MGFPQIKYLYIKSVILTIFLVGFICACSNPSNKYKTVSVTELNLHSEQYLDEKITVRGYLSDDGFLLFESKEDWEIRDISNALFVSRIGVSEKLDIDSCNNSFVVISGRYGETYGNKYEPKKAGVYDISAMYQIMKDLPMQLCEKRQRND